VLITGPVQNVLQWPTAIPQKETPKRHPKRKGNLDRLLVWLVEKNHAALLTEALKKRLVSRGDRSPSCGFKHEISVKAHSLCKIATSDNGFRCNANMYNK
jgi:hypothetical protein